MMIYKNYNLIKLNTARNALRYVIRLYNIKLLHIPYYICPVIREGCLKENCKICFYHIDDNFLPTKKFKKDDFILYPNYFGICKKNATLLSKTYKNLIVDNAHAFFEKPAGLASIYSLRKFFNVQDGAFLYLKENKKLDKKFLVSKNCPIKNFNSKNFDHFLKNEVFLDTQDIKIMSLKTQNLFKKINLKNEIKKRQTNFKYWQNILKNKNKLNVKLKKDAVPYVYPYLSSDDSIIKELSYMNIIRLWNNLPKNFPEYKFYKHLVPIPLDIKPISL